MARKNYISGFGEKDPDAAAFLKPDNTNPFEQGSAYDAGDDKGYERGEQSRGRYPQSWESRGGDDLAFAKPSDTSDDGNLKPQDISGQVFGYGGPAGNQLTGGGPVRQVRRK